MKTNLIINKLNSGSKTQISKYVKKVIMSDLNLRITTNVLSALFI